jgi:hypothetical protein
MTRDNKGPIDKPIVRRIRRTTYLIANIEKSTVEFVTQAGPLEIPVRGSIGFQAQWYPRRRYPTLSLMRLNLVTDGVKTDSGDSGVVGLMLAKQTPVEYDHRTGKLSAAFELVLHYPLIDRKMGFREKRLKGDTNFVPYTETVAAQLHGRLPQPIMEDKGEVPVAMGLDGELVHSYVKAVMAVKWKWDGILIAVLHLTSILPIQPVFIGTGPEDASATGTAFDELMTNARDMWRRCGTVHCLTFSVRDPVYLDNDDYRVIDDGTEFEDFSYEHSSADAVEIFVAERLDSTLAVNTGGGGTYSSGTASARIVTCDQQLNVPCPAPCGSGSCGDVNHYHLAHELGHAINLDHPSGAYGLQPASSGSVMEPSGWCADNPNAQSAKNCRNFSSPLLLWGLAGCGSSPDIDD